VHDVVNRGITKWLFREQSSYILFTQRLYVVALSRFLTFQADFIDGSFLTLSLTVACFFLFSLTVSREQYVDLNDVTLALV